MNPARQLLVDVLRTLCRSEGGVRPAPFRAAMILRVSGPVWGNWYHVYEVLWRYCPPESYERTVTETGYWPSNLADAHRWAAEHIAPPPVILPCPSADAYCQQAAVHDLRYMSAVPRVLDACPWLPERLAAVELLEELS